MQSPTTHELSLVMSRLGVRGCPSAISPRVLLTGDTEAREEHRQALHTRSLKRWSMSQNYKRPELTFRALLTEDGTQRVELAPA